MSHGQTLVAYHPTSPMNVLSSPGVYLDFPLDLGVSSYKIPVSICATIEELGSGMIQLWPRLEVSAVSNIISWFSPGYL